LRNFFLSYTGENQDIIDPHGLIKFVTDLDIIPNDVALLVLGFHMEASIMGVFTKDEFISGLSKLKANSIGAIREMLPKLREELKVEKQFTEIYKYAHQFYKENPNHKVISLEVADSVLEMLANDRRHIPHFRKFLFKQKEYKGVNIDQWMNNLDFSCTVAENLEDYNESSSWPYLIDMFVEFVKEGHTGDSEEEKEVKKEKKPDEYEFEF